MYGDGVSNEELLEDIRLNELESDAYYNIYNGFRVLSNLPENEGVNRRTYEFEYQKYLNLLNQCNKFLEKLKSLKAERNLL